MKRNRFWRARQELKFWWQRRTRGWDDSDLWNFDHSLAKLIAPRLKAFAKSHSGYPAELTEEQWCVDLQAMVNAFEIIGSDSCWDSRTAEEDAEIQRGLDLFAKYFRALWN